MYARMYAREYDCQDTTSDTRGTHTTGHGTQPEHTTTGKGRKSPHI